jgi:uncharacterized protein YjbJ (UPF0337 family)
MSEYNRQSDMQTDVSRVEPESGSRLNEGTKANDSGDTMSNVQEQAGQYAGQAKEKAGEYADKARDQAEVRKDQAAGGMESAASQIREKVAGSDGMTAQAGTKVAEGMESAATYLRGHDTNEMWHDFESYARTHPGQTLAGAVVAGFLLGRLLR